MIPDAAVEAAAKVWQANDSREGFGEYELREYADDVRKMLEAAAPHMMIHVHHHDIEHHARSFNEGYETAIAQGLADDPTLAQDWLDAKLAEAWEAAYGLGYADRNVGAAPTRPNPYRSQT